MPDSDTLLRRDEVARLLNIAPSTVTYLTKRGVLPAVRLSEKVVRYRRDEIERVLRERSDWEAA